MKMDEERERRDERKREREGMKVDERKKREVMSTKVTFFRKRE